MDGPAFREWARLMHRRSGNLAQEHRWAMISATATVHNLIVAARNIRDFAPTWHQDVQSVQVRGLAPYSHSIVPGGLLVMSYVTRLIPRTSLTIRVATRARNSMLNG